MQTRVLFWGKYRNTKTTYWDVNIRQVSVIYSLRKSLFVADKQNMSIHAWVRNSCKWQPHSSNCSDYSYSPESWPQACECCYVHSKWWNVCICYWCIRFIVYQPLLFSVKYITYLCQFKNKLLKLYEIKHIFYVSS